MNRSVDGVTPFLLETADIRGAHVRLSATWQWVVRGRRYPAAIRNALGELAAFAALLSARLKNPTRITLQAQGRGLVPLWVVDLSPDRELRAVAQQRDEAIPIADDTPLRTLLGDDAQLAVILELPAMVKPYVSLVPWVGERLAHALEAFLTQSEQQPTRLWLAADEEVVAGLWLQKLLTADGKDPDGWSRVTLLAQTVSRDELLKLESAPLLRRLFAEEEVRLFDPIAIHPFERREPERIERLLRLIGREEVEAMLAEKGFVEIRDELSGHTYRLNRSEALAPFTHDLPTSPHIH